LAKQLGVAYENHDITQGLLAFDLPLDEPPRRPMGTGD
jgi:hypothetical protein